MATNDKWKEKQAQDLTDEDEKWRVKAMTLCLLMISIDTYEKFAKAKAYAENLLDQALASPAPRLRRHCHLQCLGEILNVDLGKVEKFLITAVLISFLSGSVDLATLYLIAQRPARSSHPGP